MEHEPELLMTRQMNGGVDEKKKKDSGREKKHG
jgi:hypothetical protein